MKPFASSIHAAQYVRMSTERQDFSIDHQMAMNAAYARKRGLQIVQTYQDAGISGLTIDARPGLKALIADVVSGRSTYGTILVYDVSRWGRFQNPDQSAHYEFLCSEAGVKIEYCAESFDNDGSLASTLIKQIKRTMAAEFSRELSMKVSHAQRALMAKGYWMGGQPPFGYRKIIADQAGNPLVFADSKVWKKQQGIHIRLIPGPAEEVTLLRRIFKMYLRPKANVLSVTRDLVREGATRNGAAWGSTVVSRLLRNEIYVGRFVTDRRMKGIGRCWGPPRPRSDWVIVENAFPSLVPLALFDAVQAKMATRLKLVTAEEAQADLERLLRVHGRINQTIIRQHGRWSYNLYTDRIGPMKDMRQLIGAKTDPRHDQLYDFLQKARQAKAVSGQIYTDEQLLDALRGVLARHGRLDHNLINAVENSPTYGTICRRFGGIFNAYRLVGYEPSHVQAEAIRSANRRVTRAPGRYRRAPWREKLEQGQIVDQPAGASASRTVTDD